MSSPKRLLARRILNAAISTGGDILAPGLGSLLDAIYSVTHPEKIEAELVAWQKATDSNVELLVNAIFPTIRLTDSASEVAIDLCNSSEKGRRRSGLYTIEAINSEFPDMSREQVEDCIGELLHYGLVSEGPTGQTMVTPEYPLFWLFDPISNLGNDPFEDSRLLAREALSGPIFNTRKVAERLDWSPRRINPALAYLINEIGEHFIISKESNPDFIAVSMRNKTETRYELRVFLGEI